MCSGRYQQVIRQQAEQEQIIEQLAIQEQGRDVEQFALEEQGSGQLRRREGADVAQRILALWQRLAAVERRNGPAQRPKPQPQFAKRQWQHAEP
jgi:hypothetical protein